MLKCLLPSIASTVKQIGSLNDSGATSDGLDMLGARYPGSTADRLSALGDFLLISSLTHGSDVTNTAALDHIPYTVYTLLETQVRRNEPIRITTTTYPGPVKRAGTLVPVS